MIEVEHLAKTYGALSAIRDVSFTVATGEACGFLGPNGAGKTTTMRIITGFMPATSGTVRVEGFDVFESPIDVRRRIGYLPEHPPLYLEMRVRAYLDHVARLRGISGARVKTARDAVISDCGLEGVTDRLCGHLSKGYRQRVGLAQALIHNPAVLVLDEPTIGLDPAQILEIRELIRQLAIERTVVLSTHILAEVTQTCRKVVIIDRGHVALEADLSNLTQRGSLESEYLRCVSGDDVSGARTNHA